MLNVNHPEYPSAHASVTTAIVTALEAYFGSQRVRVTVTSTATGGSRTYDSLSAIIDELTEARILAGLHFRFSTRAGRELGASVANWVIDRHFSD